MPGTQIHSFHLNATCGAANGENKCYVCYTFYLSLRGATFPGQEKSLRHPAETSVNLDFFEVNKQKWVFIMCSAGKQ